MPSLDKHPPRSISLDVANGRPIRVSSSQVVGGADSGAARCQHDLLPGKGYTWRKKRKSSRHVLCYTKSQIHAATVNSPDGGKNLFCGTNTQTTLVHVDLAFSYLGKIAKPEAIKLHFSSRLWIAPKFVIIGCINLDKPDNR